MTCGKWQDWTLSELLVRWLSGNLDFEIFKSVEPGMKLVEAFEKLEYDLLPPPLGVVLHVSAEVAAGWYSRPTASPFWVARPSRSSIDDTDYTSGGSSSDVGDVNNTYRKARGGFESKINTSIGGQAYSFEEFGSAEVFDTPNPGEGYESDGSNTVEEDAAKRHENTRIDQHSYVEDLSSGEDSSSEDKPVLVRRTKKLMKEVPLVWGRKTGRTVMATEYIG